VILSVREHMRRREFMTLLGGALRGRSRRALFAEPHEAELIWTGKTYR
jgi:hypothetical protein